LGAYEEYFEIYQEFKDSGTVRTDLPPRKDEKYFNPKMEAGDWHEKMELGFKRLKRIVTWAYCYSEFYRREYDKVGVKPDDLKSFDDLQKFPWFRKGAYRKDMIERNPPFGTIPVPELLQLVRNLCRSTGTTGIQVPQFFGPLEWDVFTDMLARWIWMGGFRPGGLFQDFFPMGRGYSWGTGVWTAVQKIGGTVIPECGIIWTVDSWTSTEFISRIAKPYLEKGLPIHGCTSPSLTLKIGMYYAEKGLEPPFTGFTCLGQPISKGVRDLIKKHFKHVDFVQNAGGTTEGVVYGECKENQLHAQHHFDDCEFVEIVDPRTGEWVGPSERGEVVWTLYYHLINPYVRFSIEDVAPNEWEITCECGRTTTRHPYMYVGRTKDLFKVGDKVFLPYDLEEAITDIPEVIPSQYQVIMEDDQKIFKGIVESDKKITDELKKKINETIEKKLGVPVQIEIVEPGKIPYMGYKLIQVSDRRTKKLEERLAEVLVPKKLWKEVVGEGYIEYLMKKS